MNHLRSKTWGFVLAGGASTRMGEDKALLRYGDQFLLEQAIRRLEQVCSRVTIVGDPQKYAAYGRTMADVMPGNGPMSGIHAALSVTEAEFNFILAVDTPLVSRNLLEVLLRKAATTHHSCVIPHADNRLHPLVGVYRRTALPLVVSALEGGRLSMRALVEPVACVVCEDELSAAGIAASELTNVNTQAELARLRAYSAS